MTRLQHAAENTEEVFAFWRSKKAQVIAQQPGFRASLILSSTDTDSPQCTAVTVWDSPEDFERFYDGDHVSLNEPIQRVGMQVESREALDVVAWTSPEAEEMRIIRMQLDPEEYDSVLEYWKSDGKALVLRQPGNLGAWMLRDNDSTEISLVFAWRRAEDGERFRLSQEHVHSFAPGLGSNARLIELKRLRIIQSAVLCGVAPLIYSPCEKFALELTTRCTPCT